MNYTRTFYLVWSAILACGDTLCWGTADYFWVLPGFPGDFSAEYLRAFRMETISEFNQRVGDSDIQRTNRFAPALASLRCARPTRRLKRIGPKVAQAGVRR